MRLYIIKDKRLICFIATFLICYAINCAINNPRGNLHFWNKTGSVTIFHESYLPTKSVKKIVLWTTFFEQPHNMDEHRRCLAQCDAQCDVTDDKMEADYADAIEFHLSDLWRVKWRIGTKWTIDLPNRRKPEQVWIVYNLEPPIHMWGNLEIFNGLFNWTKWYRLDSDIPSPYGYSKELTDDEKVEASKELAERNFFREKSKDIYLRISNCYDQGQRYKLIAELGKHFHIDKFGKCYDTKCDDILCGDGLLRKYKFHLAFENDHCIDYLTEKYWQTLKRDQIPIVNWKHGAFSGVIPNSYINLFDFPDLFAAIRYIKLVNSNQTLYNSYFHYRSKYKDQARTCNMCAVCRALHDPSRKRQVYTDLESWIRDDTCKKVEVSVPNA